MAGEALDKSARWWELVWRFLGQMATAGLALAGLWLPAAAAEEPLCRSVRLADVGWSDVAATNAIASVVLEALGYRPEVTMASIPITFAGLKNRQLDVFLGYWNPHMAAVAEQFVKTGQVKVLEPPNLAGARYALAVPQYLYDKGLRDFTDIARFEKDLQGRIHGIEPGSDGNALIQGMLRDGKFGLKDFQLVESSEAGMLLEVQRAMAGRKAIVFLGWEPHPMNIRFKMRYLGGGDAVFGPKLGVATVHTVVSSTYEARCPNVAAFLRNLRFTVDMESQVMGAIVERVKPLVAARNFLKRNTALLGPWLEGIATFDGQDGLQQVLAALKS